MRERSPDYRPIAARYDERYRYDGLGGVAEALTGLARECRPERILEVGCGTGHWLVHLAAEAPVRVGLDLSREMLAQARGKEEALPLVRGSGEALPFAGSCFDLVLCVNALHHFGEPSRFIEEAHRLLAPGGVVAVVGMDPRVSSLKWQYQYFPETREIDLARIPSWGTVLDWMAAAGFSQMAWRPVERIHDPKVGREMLTNPFLRKHSSSQLALLSEEAYQAGLRRIEAAITAGEERGEPVVFEMEVTLAMLVGRKQSISGTATELPRVTGS